jgi:anaerobic ribonucleoside-triphosphate reductase activating protein
MSLRLAYIDRESIADGPGFRLVVYCQGCPHNCAGCHNPDTHDPDGGRDCDASEVIEYLKENPLIEGVTISGGEPMDQAGELVELIKAIRKYNKELNIWCYSGYTWEEIQRNREMMRLLKQIDVLVDGPYIESQRHLELVFKGSLNQRIIDVVNSLKSGRIVIVSDIS